MLLSNLGLLATAPGGVARLRELILTLAVQGKLVPQDPADEPASVLLQKIRAEKDRLIAEGRIKRHKPLAEIAGEEKLFELPNGWEWVQLGELLPFRIGRTPPSKDPQYWADSGHAWVSISDMNHLGEVLETARKITDRGAGVFGYDPLPSGTLIMSFKLTIGKVSVLRVPAYHNEAIVSFTPLSGLDSGFLKYMLPTAAKTGASKDALMGATLNTESLSKLVIALPPGSEQSRIVTRVEELMRLCDTLEAKGQLEATQHAQLVSTLLGALTASTTPEELAESWQRVAQHFDLLLDRPKAIDALEQTLLQLAVRGLLVPQDPTDEPASALLQKIRAEKDRLIAEGQIRLDKPLPPITDEETPFELPVGWAWCQLDELVTIRGGKRVSNGYQLLTVPTEFVYIRVSDMKDGSIDDSDLRYLDPQMRSAISRYIVTKNDIYMTIVGATIGKCGLVPERFDGMNLTENAARLTPHLVSKDYLFRLLGSEFCQEQFLGKTKQVGVQKMALNRLAGTLISLPPLAEQSRIVARVTALRRLCADLRQRLKAAQATQSHLAQALVESSNAL
jgi:type I restriction enzyme S subunit